MIGARALLLGQAGGDSGGGGAGAIILIIYLGIIVLTIAGLWKVFTKAGQPGWGAIIPIYNIVLLIQVAGRPLWWIILMFIPFVNIIISIVIALDIAKNFEKGVGFAIGLIFLPFIFYPILGFGDAIYKPVK